MSFYKKINKKRISILMCMIAISIFSCSITNRNNEETIVTMSVPVTNKVIVIDAGHGGEDEGDCLLTLINNN